MLAVLAGWVGQYLYSRSEIPACTSTPVQRELTRSLARMTATTPKNIATARYREREVTAGGPTAGAKRLCQAQAVIADEAPRTVRYNIVAAAGERQQYQVRVAELHAPAERP